MEAGNTGDQDALSQGRDPILNVAFVIATISVRLQVCYQIDGYTEVERLPGGQGCRRAADARSSLLAESRRHPPACRSASLVSGSDPCGFVPCRGHPNGFQALPHTMGPSDLPGQGGVPSITPDGLRYLLR